METDMSMNMETDMSMNMDTDMRMNTNISTSKHTLLTHICVHIYMYISIHRSFWPSKRVKATSWNMIAQPFELHQRRSTPLKKV